MVQVKKKGPQTRDFKKVKAMGYGKARNKPKANVVNTKMRTRALMMPYQKVSDTARLEREEVTRRNLSIDELLPKLGHHNAKARRDALLGLRELVTQHQSILHARLGVVLHAALQGLERGGENEKADAALLALLRTVLSLVPQERMQPHGALVAAYLMSSFTHLRLSARMLGIGVLDACLEFCPRAVLQAVDVQQLLVNLAATLTNRFHSGLMASASTTRLKLWATIVRVQRMGAIAQSAQRVQPSCFSALPTMSTLYLQLEEQAMLGPMASGRNEATSTDLLAPLVLQELFESIPGSDLAVMELLTESMALMIERREGATQLARDSISKGLNHIAGNFPLSPTFSLANLRAATLLLASGNAQWASVAAMSGAASMLTDRSLPPGARVLLLQGCQVLWQARGAFDEGSAGLHMVEAFTALFRARLSAATRLECTPCLQFLLSSTLVPDSVTSALLAACAKCLWLSVLPASTGVEGDNNNNSSNSTSVDVAAQEVLRSLWCYVRRADAFELLTSLLVPFFSVQLDDAVRFGPFAALSAQSQVLAVRLYSCLDTLAPIPLLDAWARALCSPSTHEDAALALIHVLHSGRRKLFPTIASYLKFICCRTLLQGQQSRRRCVLALCACIRDAGLLEGANVEAQHRWLLDPEVVEVQGRTWMTILAAHISSALQADNPVLMQNALSVLATLCAGAAVPAALLQLVPHAVACCLEGSDWLLMEASIALSLFQLCPSELMSLLVERLRVVPNQVVTDRIAVVALTLSAGMDASPIAKALRILPLALQSSVVSACLSSMLG
jgi:hypothetical protein